MENEAPIGYDKNGIPYYESQFRPFNNNNRVIERLILNPLTKSSKYIKKIKIKKTK